MVGGVIRGVIYIHTSLTSTLERGKRRESNLCRFAPVSHLIEGWIDLKANLNALEVRLITYLCWQWNYYLIRKFMTVISGTQVADHKKYHFSFTVT
jgi:hypothetical protein